MWREWCAEYYNSDFIQFITDEEVNGLKIGITFNKHIEYTELNGQNKCFRDYTPTKEQLQLILKFKLEAL